MGDGEVELRGDARHHDDEQGEQREQRRRVGQRVADPLHDVQEAIDGAALGGSGGGRFRLGHLATSRDSPRLDRKSATRDSPGRSLWRLARTPDRGSIPRVKKVKNWLAERLGVAAGEESPQREQARNLAVAALLVEVLRADYDVSGPERRQVLDSIRGILRLDPAECETLLELAEQRVDEAHDLHQFTSEVNRAFSADEKVGLVEQLWRVAQADATVHKYEEHLIRRISDLLHVPHRQFIAAKLRGAAH